MKYALLTLLGIASIGLSTTTASAMENRPYKEGPVTEVSFVKTKPGMFDAYMKWVATTRKQMIDEEKKAGIIIESKVFTVEPRHPGDPDVILTETFANMATLDGLDDRLDPIMEKVAGSVQKSNEAAVDREKLREVLGSELIREMVLK